MISLHTSVLSKVFQSNKLGLVQLCRDIKRNLWNRLTQEVPYKIYVYQIGHSAYYDLEVCRAVQKYNFFFSLSSKIIDINKIKNKFITDEEHSKVDKNHTQYWRTLLDYFQLI